MEHQTATDGMCNDMSCSLSATALRQRKATVLAELRRDIREIRETDTGYAWRFDGSDSMLDRLLDFIKSERQCCGFLTFTLSVADARSEVWLELSGPAGTKEFITGELGFDTAVTGREH